MADEEINEGEETPEGSEESSVLKLQRQRADAAEAELAVLKQEKVDAELVAQQLREEALEEIVNALEIPNLKEDLLGWIKGEITEESVDAALKAKGLNFVKEGTPIEAPQPTAPLTPAPIPVSTLGQQVADAASGQTAKTLDQQLAEAKTPAEVNALMEEAGAAVSYT
jgi:uncharacterized protein YbcC (UPF0753/DUF2309 family)